MNDVVKKAEEYCEEKGLRFTPTRRDVLGIIARSTKPITAYEILDELKSTVKNPKPPIVYRATDFLQEHGFIHRIESLNGFVLCAADHHHHGSQFMICDSCGKATEAHLCDILPSVSAKAEKAGFDLSHWNLELHGRCGDCQGSGA